MKSDITPTISTAAPIDPRQQPRPVPSGPPRHHRLRWTLITVAALIGVILITGGWLFYRAISAVNTQKLDSSNKKLSFFQQLTGIITKSDEHLSGEDDDRINILLLGIGGPGHQGPYLTDTMMVASVKPSTKQVALISIPRDLVVDIPGYDYRKINNVLSFGRDQDYPGGGDALVMKVVGDLLDLPIHYYGRIDFSGFAEVIDTLGGITVTVDNAFTDYEYPDNNYGYQTVRFQVGVQTMDGDLALKFARSRHGNNGEGSDFARAARQQKIILATRDKAMSLGTLLNPAKIGDILGSIATHHQTNMEVWEIIRLAKMVSEVEAEAVISRVLDNSATGLLVNATGQNGAYILQPKDGTGTDIKFLANNIFLIGAAEAEPATVLVVNATAHDGLADTMEKSLSGFGLNLADSIGSDGTTVNTVIIDPSRGQYPRTMELIGLYARARGSTTLADWTAKTGDQTLAERLAAGTTINGNGNLNAGDPTVNLVLILGQDQLTTPTNSAAE